MNEVAEVIAGDPHSPILIIADHASNRVPDDVSLGIPDHLLDDHVAVDIGAGALARALASHLDCPAILARFSRLVVDLNRDAADAITEVSDGHKIWGNKGLDAAVREARLERFWYPYHALISERIEILGPRLLCSVHSFTPQLASRPDHRRPWQVGILYNQDDRAALPAIETLRAQGVVTGDNEPYSGRELNATMNRHAEARGLPYLGFEVRQDLIGDAEGVADWAGRLAPVVAAVVRTLA
jgi:predicted N-formylglutamate amidohydrolase